MTSKLEQFKSRCESAGQLLSLARRSVEGPFTAYDDPYLGGADPASDDYPTSGRVLPAYEAAAQVRAFVQPAKSSLQGNTAPGFVVTAPWGQEVKIALVAYVPCDVAIGLTDRATFDGTDYIVVALNPNYAGDVAVFYEALLTPAVPGMD